MSNTELYRQANQTNDSLDELYNEADKAYDANDYVKAFSMFLKLAASVAHCTR